MVQQLLDEHQDEVYEDGTVFQDSYYAIDPAPYGAQAAYQLQLSLIHILIGPLLFLLLPLLTPAFWAFLGWQYARSGWKALPAVLTANSLGILSLAVYLWQFFGHTVEARNLALAGASQMFSASTPTWFLGRFAILFESLPNYVGRAAMMGLQVLACLLYTSRCV